MHTVYPTKSLKELVGTFLETSPFQKQLTSAMIRSTWQKIMPKVVCDRTEKLYIQNKKLFVTITSAPLRQELQFNNHKVIDLFKEAMPEYALEKIIFL
ncbi:MAG: DUF721 domain-containing protein [Amoebophilaceae bacterium]|nr:DUF721 domain-containing protein [Amoebophilaceae bacterium]